MKFKFLCMLLLGSIMTMAAQNTGSISGKIIDSKTKEALPYVSIVLKENGTVTGGGISEENGTFTIKGLPLKNYAVEIQFMGYKTVNLTANLSDAAKSINLGTINIVEEAATLDEVNIVKEVSTIEQKLDRKVITVGRDLTTAGATASDIMNNIPSVNVDQDGKISLRGNQNVRILIDGRPTNLDPAQLLKQIPSTMIKKIELITNPSAKYNPEGMSGIINIVLHKNANDGFNGSFNSGMTFGITPKFNNSLDMNYRKGKVNFFGNIGNNFGKHFNDGFVNRYDVVSKQLIDVVNDNENYLGKIGLDYYINDNNTLSVYTNQNYSNGLGDVNTGIIYPTGAFEDISQTSTYDSDNYNNSYNLAFKHKFEKEGHTLDFEANYNDTKTTQDGAFSTVIGSAAPEAYNDHLVDKRGNVTANLDYVNPLSEKSTLEAGAEVRTYRTKNNYNTNNPVVTDPQQQDVYYTYDMDIYSAYATFGQKFDKFSYQIGARLESYKVEADFNHGYAGFKDDYITVYPSAYLTYNINEKNMMQISYGRRVDRPSIEQTKPIREFSTPLFTSFGNPELRPQFTNSVEWNYTKMFGKGSSVTGGIFYRFVNDEISRIFYPNETTPDNDNDQIMSYGNFDKTYSYGFEVSMNYRIFKWWDIQPAIDFSSIRQRGMISQLVAGTTNDYEFITKTVDVNAFNARLNSNFRVNDRLSFNLFGFYRGPVSSVQNKSKEMYKIDSGARYTLLDNKMSLSVRFNDMFKTMRYGFDSNNPFTQSGEFRWESRTVYFGINYMFGGGKNRAMQRKQRDDNTKQGGGGMF
ncbi:MAG: TonB-dependent receptor [Flavobacterium psychrophilum]|nr:MAG: TonB-dependent receptor [Flavobacterium psychrophilum]